MRNCWRRLQSRVGLPPDAAWSGGEGRRFTDTMIVFVGCASQLMILSHPDGAQVGPSIEFATSLRLPRPGVVSPFGRLPCRRRACQPCPRRETDCNLHR